MNNDNSFLGSGWGFPPEFNRKSGSVSLVSGEEDIKESLYILLSTKPNERVMQSAYGCGLTSLVFESIDSTSITLIKDAITRAVIFFESRIDLEDIEIDEKQAQEGILLINLTYTVRTTNTRTNMVYPFYFQEGTNLAGEGTIKLPAP